MADLKLGTTVGGSSIWHQGNFPLVPTGNTLVYNGFTIYSTNDKPQASNNDFVSKASGGIYLGQVNFNLGIMFPTGTDTTRPNYIKSGSGDGATQTTTNINLISWQGLGFQSPYNADGSQNTSGNNSIWFNLRTGDINTIGSSYQVQASASAAAPTAVSHLTRKDYVDTSINTVTTNANSRVLRIGDTMTGSLTAPNFLSTNAATLAAHVPRLDQVIVKGTIIDFGTF